MVLYHFILLSDNNDARRFYIEVTAMKNPRLRFSALKSLYKKYLKNEAKYKPIFEFFKCDYSYYVLDQQHFDFWEDAMNYAENLQKERYHKLKHIIPIPKNGMITFD